MTTRMAYGITYGMRKTTVYMSDPLKAQLARAAAESGRSEADLIREGIELVSGRRRRGATSAVVHQRPA